MTKLAVEDWRLTPGFVAFVSVGGKNRKVWLCARDKKVYKTALKKEIPSDIVTKELHPDLNEMELKFVRLEKEWGEEAGLFIRNPEIFPDDSWYQVMNFYKDHLVNFLLDTSSCKGEFSGQVFEAIFSETEPTLVSFVSPDMTKYNKYFEEMKRRLNCEFGKKVKKWVPGHRYDTLKESYYYLGSFLSRKSIDTNSEFLDDSKMTPIHLYVNSIKDTDKDVSDILRTRIIGTEPNDIKVLRTFPSAFDTGDAINNDLGDDIRIYWEEMLDTATEACKSTIEGSDGYIKYVDTRRIFDVLSIQSPDRLDYSQSITDKVSEIIKKLCVDVVFTNYGIVHADKNLDIKSSQSIDANVDAIIRNLCFKTRDPNLLRTSYYNGLVKRLGIDTRSIAAEVVKSFNESSLCTDFDTFRKYSFYFDMRRPELDVTSKQRDKSALYKTDPITVESLFGGGELTDTIKKLVSFAKDNCGFGVDVFNVYNVGTKKSPNEYIHCIITLKNLIDFVGGVDKMSDQLKAEILGRKFTRVVVTADKDATIE